MFCKKGVVEDYGQFKMERSFMILRFIIYDTNISEAKFCYQKHVLIFLYCFEKHDHYL